MKTDTEKTLEILKLAGNRGIHSFELNRLVGTIRAGARIYDLKKQGYSISSLPEKLGDAVGVRYFLNSPYTQKQSDAIQENLQKYRIEFDNEHNIARRVLV